MVLHPVVLMWHLSCIGSIAVNLIFQTRELTREKGVVKTKTVALCAGLWVLGMTGTAQAALYDRGGGLIYDDVLNITWLQDANYAQTSGYDTDGKMTWGAAVAWADGLSYYDSVRDITYDDWRLPTVAPIDGSTFDYNWAADGSTDLGYHISDAGTTYAGATGSELAYMYYNNLLGNEPYYNTDGSNNSLWTGVVSPDFTDATDGLTESFEHLQSSVYWSGTEYAPNTYGAWLFHTYDGYQSNTNKSHEFYAWAVRSGDVSAVPIPGAVWLFGSGMLGLAGMVRRKR